MILTEAGAISDSELIARAADGHRAACERLAARYHQAVFRMIYYRVGRRMDAEDLTQEVFIQMLRRLPTLRRPDRFRSWLFRIATNRVRDFRRKRWLQRALGTIAGADDPPEAADPETPETRLMDRDFRDGLFGFLDTLSKWEREVFLLRFMDGLTIPETAEVLGRGESTIKTHLYRAIRKFKASPELREMIDRGDLP